MIISFAWTTAALLAGAKTVTRRDWKKQHAMQFAKGKLVDAYDRSPRTHGRKVATIRILRDPYVAWSTDLTDEDYEREGFNWLKAHGDWQEVGEVVAGWGSKRRLLYVVEFKLVSVERDWREPMRPLPGPVASEELQMSVAERDRLQRGVEELARTVADASAGASEGDAPSHEPSQLQKSETPG